jgi:hypothetical protein
LVEADDGSPPPVTDAAKRIKIEAKLTAARAQAQAADAATRSVASQGRSDAGLRPECANSGHVWTAPRGQRGRVPLFTAAG